MPEPKIAAIIPMRHHSERVQEKNYRPFAGDPLFFCIIRALRAVKTIGQVVIDTDSETIMGLCREHFPDVVLLERPAHLRDDGTPMNDVLLHTTDQIDADFFLQTHSTNPLLRAETIAAAVDRFLEGYPIYDSLFGVTRMQTRLWDQLSRPVNHNPSILLRTQDLPPIYEENSNLYIFTREDLARRHNRIGERPLMFEVDAREAWDIDDLLDFRVAEILYQEQRATGPRETDRE